RRSFLGMTALAGARLKARAPFASGARGFSRAPEIERTWDGPVLRARIVNRTTVPMRLDDVVVFEAPLTLPAETALYGEGFQMLTQTAGPPASPQDLSQYTDAKHYRIPASGSARAYYGLLTLSPPSGGAHVFAFTSCARFSGRFEIAASAVRAIVDCE